LPEGTGAAAIIMCSRKIEIARTLLALAMLSAISACSSAPVNFTTQLDQTGGLGPGDPVVHAAATIGSVTSVSPLGDGDSEVGFQVEGAHVKEVHQDAIMLLNTQPGTPSLEVMNQDAMSPAAAPGMRLDGASDSYQAQMIMLSRGPGSLATALSNSINAFPSSSTQPPSQSSAQLGQMLNQIVQQNTAIANAINPPTAAEVSKMKSDAAAVERQFTRNNKTAQANRVRQQLNQSLAGLGVKASSPSPTP
jgi:hypothetical protein